MNTSPSVFERLIPLVQPLFASAFHLAKFVGFALDSIRVTELDKGKYIEVTITYNPRPSRYTRPFVYRQHFNYDDAVSALSDNKVLEKLVQNTLKEVYNSFVVRNK